MASDRDSRRNRKVADITNALSVSPVDVAALRRMAISEGGAREGAGVCCWAKSELAPPMAPSPVTDDNPSPMENAPERQRNR